MNIPAPTLASETLFSIGSFEVRNTLFMAWAAMLVLFILAGAARGTGYKLIPGRLQAMFELIVEGLFDFFDSILENRTYTRFFFPFVATMFLFILAGNWMGILPGISSLTVLGTHHGETMRIPLIRSMNADVNMTLVFAVFAVVAAQVAGIVTLGILPHLGKYFVAPWRKPYFFGTFVGLLEFIGEFARLVSFTFRLFGNIFAGEVLLIVISVLAPYAALPFYGMELFVGFIQALVFSMLTLVFLKMAMTPHGDNGDGHGHAMKGARA